MGIGLSVTEGAVLHGLLAEAAGDIVIKLDADGFIQHASSNLSQLGFDLSQLLLLPHVADLADRCHRDAVSKFVSDALTGATLQDWVEFPLVRRSCEIADEGSRWYALGLRSVINEDGEPSGALGLLRSVEQLRSLEDELHLRSLTDPVTGLDNRRAFCTTLKRKLSSGEATAVVLFEIERFRAIFLQYGQNAADEVLWAFAQFLKAMAPPGLTLAHLDGARFGAALFDTTLADAQDWCEDVLQTFAALAVGTTKRDLQLSAHAGLSQLCGSVDHSLKQSELALVLARASGGVRAVEGGQPRRRRAPRSRFEGPDMVAMTLGVRAAAS